MSKKERPMKERSKGFLGIIENVGNKLPHPAILFVILALMVIVISEIAVRAGLAATFVDARIGEKVTIEAVSLFNGEGLSFIFNNATTNFTGFAPLGTVLVAMLGVGVAEWSGLIGDALKKLIKSVPTALLTSVVVFAGIVSNIASDAGYVVIIPLGAIVFAGAGRHPLAGLAAAFAGVSGGYSANLVIGPTDALLTGITNAALESANIDYEMAVTGNWYFMIVSTFLLTIVGTIITEKVIEPKLGEYKGSYKPDDEPLTDLQHKGLKLAGLSVLVYVFIIGLMLVPENAPLRALNEDTGLMSMDNFLSQGLIFAIFLLFVIPGFVYGKTVGKIKNSNDLVEGMTQSMSSMGGYIVLAFFAAQFISYFSYTNLGMILSVNGAEFLESVGFTGIPLIIAFTLLAAFLDLFLGSASAKWAIMAPIFIPMLFNVGLTPELTQIAYRIADSTSNIITPLMSYFAMVLVFMKRYEPKSGLGTLISTMLPYSMSFLVVWLIMLIGWYFSGLPIGPGSYMTF